MPLFDRLASGFDRVNSKIEWVLQVSVYALVVIVTLEVFMRFVFHIPLIWARDTGLWFYSAMMLMPVAYYYSRKAHISASDLLQTFNLSGSQKAWLSLIDNFTLLVVVTILISPALSRVMVAIRIGEMSILTLWRPPLWPSLMLIPITFALVALQALVGVVKSIKEVIKEEAGS